MELNSFEKPGGGASVARPALDRVAAAAREGGLDLFDVIIPSRTWRIQDRVSAPFCPRTRASLELQVEPLYSKHHHVCKLHWMRNWT